MNDILGSYCKSTLIWVSKFLIVATMSILFEKSKLYNQGSIDPLGKKQRGTFPCIIQ